MDLAKGDMEHLMRKQEPGEEFIPVPFFLELLGVLNTYTQKELAIGI